LIDKLVALCEARKKDVILSEAKDLDSSVAKLPQNDKSNKEVGMIQAVTILVGAGLLALMLVSGLVARRLAQVPVTVRIRSK